MRDYYEQLFSAWCSHDINGALEGMRHLVMSKMMQQLLRPTNSKEMRTAVFQMHPTKASETDNAHAFFFQNSGI